MHVNIDDVIAAVNSARMGSIVTANDFKHRASILDKGDPGKLALEYGAEMFTQQEERLQKLLEKIEAIHEAGHDYLVGVMEV